MTTQAQPTVRYKTITPEEAHVMLKRSRRKNVPTKKRKIDQYARAMIDGKWDPYNSQAISVDENEDIVNGHQRLMACVQANKPFRTLLIIGVPPETFRNEDTGRSRDVGHFFALLGEKNYMELAVGARLLYLWERGLWRYGIGGINAVPMTNEDLQEELKRRSGLREAAAVYNKSKAALRGRFPAGLVVALHALTQGHPRHDSFWAEVIDRVGGDKESQAWQLNRRIDVAESRGTGLTKNTVCALLTKAWNSYATEDPARLVWQFGEKMPEPVTELKPELVIEEDAELITTTPKTKKRPRPADGPPVLRVVPKPEKKPKVKKERKLRGGIGS